MPKLTYGLNPASEMVSIEQVGRGKTDLICPGCRVLLTANKGPKQGWYFSHANHSKDVFCPLRSKGGSGFPYTHKNFHLPVNTRQMDELKHIHEHQHPSNEDIAQLLVKKGLIRHSPYTLTQQGKITLGLLPVAEFADFHLSLITGIELTKAQISNTPDDLPIEDSKKRLLSSNLYFVEIENDKIRNLYKFGMTSRNPKDRLKEIKNELSPHLPRGHFTVRLIAWKEGRGHCEAYLLHRFKDHEHKIGSMTEYRILSGSLVESITDELAQLDDRTPCQPVARKLSAQEIPKRTETEQLPSSSFEEKGQGFVEIPDQVLTRKPQTSRHEEPDLAADLPEVPPQLDRHNDQPAKTKTAPMKYRHEEARLSKASTKPNYEKENSLLGKVTSLLKSWWSKTSAQ